MDIMKPKSEPDDVPFSAGMALMAISLLAESGKDEHVINRKSMGVSNYAATLETKDDEIVMRLVRVDGDKLNKMFDDEKDEQEITQALIDQVNENIGDNMIVANGVRTNTNEEALANPSYAKAVTMLLFHLMVSKDISEVSMTNEQIDQYLDGDLGIHVADLKSGVSAKLIADPSKGALN